MENGMFLGCIDAHLCACMTRRHDLMVNDELWLVEIWT